MISPRWRRADPPFTEGPPATVVLELYIFDNAFTFRARDTTPGGAPTPHRLGRSGVPDRVAGTVHSAMTSRFALPDRAGFTPVATKVMKCGGCFRPRATSGRCSRTAT